MSKCITDFKVGDTMYIIRDYRIIEIYIEDSFHYAELIASSGYRGRIYSSKLEAFEKLISILKDYLKEISNLHKQLKNNQ